MTEKRFKFRRVNEITGFFVLAALALVVATAVLSGRTQRWFAHKFAFEVLLPEKGASGLDRGSEVYILGVTAGAVDEIQIGEDGRMTARVRVRSEFARFVRADSTAAIKKVFGVAGDSFLEVARGTGAPLAERAAIPCDVSEELSDRLERILNELRQEIVPVARKAGVALDKTSGTLDEWQKLGTDLNKTSQQLQQLLARVDTLAAGLEHGEGSAGKLLTDTAVVDGLQQVIADSDATLDELKAVLANVRRGTERLPEVTNALADEAKDLPGLVNQTQDTMRELSRLVEGIQRHWLIRKYVNKTNPPPLHPLPADDPPKPAPSKALRSPRNSQ